MSGLIIAPWQAGEQPPRPDGFRLGVRAVDPLPGDLRLAASLGCRMVNLRLARERLQPEGRGRLIEAAVDGCLRLIESASAARVRPVLELAGDATAWDVRDAAERWAEFAELVALRLARGIDVIAIADPARACAPQETRRLPPTARIARARAVASAHALGSEALRAGGSGSVGLSIELATAFPATSSAKDVAAARFLEASTSAAWLQLAHGRPGALLRDPGAHGAATPLRASWLGAVDREAAPAGFLVLRPSAPVEAAASPGDDLGWDARPSGARGWEPWVALAAACAEQAPADAAPELLVESRCPVRAGSAEEIPDESGAVSDDTRVAALRSDSAGWQRALAAGVALQGWMAASLIDDARDAGDRTGLVLADAAGRRIVKASGRELGRLAAEWT